jgi:hypothetical protein
LNKFQHSSELGISEATRDCMEQHGDYQKKNISSANQKKKESN